MKFQLLIFLLIHSFTLFSQEKAQVIYSVTDGSQVANPEELKDAPESVQFSITPVSEIFPRLSFKLNVINQKAHFSEIKNAQLPIRNYPEQFTGLLYQFAEELVSGGAYYIFNLNNIVYNYFKSPDGNNYIISSKANKYQWKLTKETKKISGYTCYKATTQKITNNMAGTFAKPVTAWYAPAIPIPFGPKDYNGLPGLILELQEGTIGLYATKINLNPKEKIEINKPTKGKLMTQEEYDKSNGASYERAKNLLGG